MCLSTRVEAFTVKALVPLEIPAKYTVQRSLTRIRAGDCTPLPSGRCSSACSKSKLRTWACTVANPSPRAASRIVALCCKNSVAAGSSCDSRSRSWVSRHPQPAHPPWAIAAQPAPDECSRRSPGLIDPVCRPATKGLHGRRQSAEQGQHLRAGCACRLVAQACSSAWACSEASCAPMLAATDFSVWASRSGQPPVARCESPRINLDRTLGLDKAHQHIGVQRGLAQGALKPRAVLRPLHHWQPPCQPRN